MSKTTTGGNAPAMIVRASVDDLAQRLGINDISAARAAYDAIASLPMGDDILRDLAGPSMTDAMLKLAKSLSPEMYAQAASEGMPFSMWLDKEAPAPKFAGADTFEHLMAHAGVVLVHDSNRGKRADTIAEMRTKGADLGGGLRGGSVLLVELCNRAFLTAKRWGTSWLTIDRAELEAIERFYASTSILSPLLQPELLKQQMINQPVRQATLLERLVASTEVLTGTDTWKQFYVDTSDAEAYSMRRHTEGADMATVEILAGTGHTGHTLAYGRRLLFSYDVEQWSLPLLQLHISLFSVQQNKDEESQVMGKLINGDGNPNTAANTTAISTLSLGGAGSTTEIPAQGILQYLNALEENAHFASYDIAIARGIGKTLVQISDFGDSNTRLFWGDMPSRSGQASDPEQLVHPPLAASADAPVASVMYVDTRQAILRYIAGGAPIVETDKIIRSRMNEIVFWTKWGHQRLMPNVVEILDYAN